MSITQNINRVGNVTSSDIVDLLSMGTRDMTDLELELYRRENPKSKKKTISTWPGKAAVTYINECNMERRLGRSLKTDSDAKPTTWGNFVEKVVFEQLLPEYSYNSQDTLCHPEIDYWLGSPDGFKFRPAKKTVADLKCPFTLKSFCQLVQPLYDGFEGLEAMNALRNGYIKNGLPIPPHPDGEKFYWQIISNGCIEDCNYGELIIYCPYESEIPAIQKAASIIGEPQSYFIYASPKEALPYIKDNGYYKNLNIIEFEIPPEDKEYLTEIVRKAGELLIKI